MWPVAHLKGTVRSYLWIIGQRSLGVSYWYLVSSSFINRQWPALPVISWVACYFCGTRFFLPALQPLLIGVWILVTLAQTWLAASLGPSPLPQPPGADSSSYPLSCVLLFVCTWGKRPALMKFRFGVSFCHWRPHRLVLQASSGPCKNVLSVPMTLLHPSAVGSGILWFVVFIVWAKVAVWFYLCWK